MALRSTLTYPVVGLLAGALLVALYVTAPMAQALVVLPAINDITTDLVDPPNFTVLDGPAYPAEMAARQRAGYPELGPLVIAAPANALFARARAAAITLGWSIRGEDSDAGRIEAVATTTLLRFKDDVVVRLRPHGDGTRIDLRSRSRIGIHDLGTNARRIRAFFKRLQQ